MNTATESSLKRLHRMVLKLEDWLLMLLLTGMILLASAQILLRNVFETGISWADPTLRLLVLWLSLLGAMAATRDNNHISIDLLSRFLSPGLKRVSQRIADLFAAVVCGFLAWHAGRFVLFEWEDGSRLFASLPAWVGELILPLGFGIMALRFLLAALLGRSADGEQEA
jgi:TRAP-type C4-dicarboxylate transport system permease small subunit